MTTKILALTDALGNLVRFVLLPGQRFDTVGVEPLIKGLSFDALRGGSACLDSAPLVLSGFLPGLSNAGPGDFVAAEGGRSPTAAATKSWRGYAAATNACTPK